MEKISNTGDVYIKKSLVSVTCPYCNHGYSVYMDNPGTGDFPPCPYCNRGEDFNQ